MDTCAYSLHSCLVHVPAFVWHYRNRCKCKAVYSRVKVALNEPSGWQKLSAFFCRQLLASSLFLVEDDEECEVETILDHRLKGKRKSDSKLQFLTEREGYGSENNTWEPRKHLPLRPMPCQATSHRLLCTRPGMSCESGADYGTPG